MTGSQKRPKRRPQRRGRHCCGLDTRLIQPHLLVRQTRALQAEDVRMPGVDFAVTCPACLDWFLRNSRHLVRTRARAWMS